MILTEIKKKPGTYIGVKIDEKSQKLLKQFAKENEIPNVVRTDNIHMTLVYSRQVIPNVEDMLITSFNEMPEATPTNEFHLWGDNEDTLVMKVDCPYLTERHEFFKMQGATHDYPSYEPHITISYDADCCKDKLKELKWNLGPLHIKAEYHEPLDLDWTSNNDE